MASLGDPKQASSSDRPGTNANRELVVFALFLLGGDTKRVHTEDIAIKCYELFPSAFSWTRYTQYPDKDIVRVALTDARKDRYGALVHGRSGQYRGLGAKTNREPVDDGWNLTPAGIRWIQAHRSELEQMDGTGSLKEHRQQVLKQLKRLRDHPLFIGYLRNPTLFSPPIGDMADLLRCRVDAEPSVWERRFDQVRRQAESAVQQDVLDFIAACQESYLKQR